LVASIAVPEFLLAVPCFILFALYRALPNEFLLTKHICVAVYDIWIGITAGAAISVFPIIDNRFRKVVARIPVIRMLLPYNYSKMAHSKVKSIRQIQQVGTADIYFNMLTIDLAGVK
ncbi:hypothetical protein PENTCL1PPCAC_16293, partial [Pristionchus entomophagus]